MDLSKKNVKSEKKSKAMTLRELSKKIESLRRLSIDPSPLIAEYQRRVGMVALAFDIYPSGFSFRGHHPPQGQIRQSFICLIIRRPLLHFIFSLPGHGLSKCF